MTNSRAKGARGELAARDLVREHWYSPFCMRNGQTSGLVCPDIGPVMVNTYTEVKFEARHSVHRIHEKNVRDSKEGDLSILLLRETATDNKTWLTVFDATRAEDFVQRFLRSMMLTESPEYVDAFVSKALHQR
jgi:hypothetical protein